MERFVRALESCFWGREGEREGRGGGSGGGSWW